ncbi:hypothetical protein CPB83DRAFT_894740 [Crepidotus variabilis]|uniref:GH16 domain-containing protein n=1 Tax=Crepidotus variabilis TaxID=179855 RepID=A0A9P6EEH5_9AGAR|nr:hypothetical protein CPB83DRAFT_894740 [Crepidotus variabilis]
MIWDSTRLTVSLILVCDAWAIYAPSREYAGNTFFDQWAYYGGIDNTTWGGLTIYKTRASADATVNLVSGNVTFVDKNTAAQKQLTFVNEAGHAIIRVDNQTTITPTDQVRLASPQTFGVGTLILIDALHIPYGCSVWPSFWTFGAQKEWPQAGEIDIITGINGMPNNQIALHAPAGCVKAETPGQQTGVTVEGDCSKPQGCFVAETKPNSFGEGLANAGGGVSPCNLKRVASIRGFGVPDIPDNVRNNDASFQSIDTSTRGIPSAAYPASTCNVAQIFKPQNLIISTTFCGVWAGNPDAYQQLCKTPTNSCVADNIIGPGNNFANAFWEIKYIRTYTNGIGTSASSTSSSALQTFSPAASNTAQDPDPNTAPTNAAPPQRRVRHWALPAVGFCLFLMM